MNEQQAKANKQKTTQTTDNKTYCKKKKNAAEELHTPFTINEPKG